MGFACGGEVAPVRMASGGDPTLGMTASECESLPNPIARANCRAQAGTQQLDPTDIDPTQAALEEVPTDEASAQQELEALIEANPNATAIVAETNAAMETAEANEDPYLALLAASGKADAAGANAAENRQIITSMLREQGFDEGGTPEEQIKRNPHLAMAMIMAGSTMMASQSPTLTGAMGEGIGAGAEYLGDRMVEEEDRAHELEKKRISAELGTEDPSLIKEAKGIYAIMHAKDPSYTMADALKAAKSGKGGSFEDRVLDMMEALLKTGHYGRNINRLRQDAEHAVRSVMGGGPAAAHAPEGEGVGADGAKAEVGNSGAKDALREMTGS